MTQTEAFIVQEEELGQRLDKLLSLRFPSFSRTYFQSLIEKGFVLINGEQSKKREKPILLTKLRSALNFP
jgi:23S rRNA pseudouridine1911/1915/1917 synthase